MPDYSKRTVCVVDCGLFIELAVTLSKSFAKVLYYSPWESSFPKSNSTLIGHGVEGVTRINDIWSSLDDIDLFVFPDVYFGALQVHLASLGKRVWGGRMGERLELDRDWSKKLQDSLGIDTGPYKVITGLDALREYLKKNPDQYVKVSASRGDMETFRSKNYALIEPRLDELEHNLGAKKKVMQFIVEEAINDAVEIGYDGYCIDGKYPKNGTCGIEVKDRGFVMKAKKYADMPEQITDMNGKLSEYMESVNYRGFWSTEIRVTKDGGAYSIDPCARCGSPPNELYQLMFENLPEILWHGAMGELVEPQMAAPWGAELLIHSSWADSNWQAVQFPKSVRENVKLRNLTVIDGKYYCVPQSVGLPEIGAVVALGHSMENAIKNVGKIAEKIEGHYLEVFSDSLDEACSQFEKLKSFGIEL